MANSLHATTAPTPIPDRPGCDLRPRPEDVTTAAEFCSALRSYRIWTGEPSYARMAVAIRHAVSASTLHRAVAGDALPKLAHATAVVAGCGGRDDEQERYARAWRRPRARADRSLAGIRP